MSQECAEALDERYWNRPVLCDMHSNERHPRRPQWWPHPRNDTVVWREGFEAPLALRAQAEAATRDPACRLREHEFRLDRIGRHRVDIAAAGTVENDVRGFRVATRMRRDSLP